MVWRGIGMLILGLIFGMAITLNIVPSDKDPVCVSFNPASGECIKTTTREDLIREAQETESAK